MLHRGNESTRILRPFVRRPRHSHDPFLQNVISTITWFQEVYCFNDFYEILNKWSATLRNKEGLMLNILTGNARNYVAMTLNTQVETVLKS